jgi:thiamine-monophosphate kinase
LLRLSQPCYNPTVKVSQLGEFNLIDRLAEVIKNSCRTGAPSWHNLVMGIGDDAAVWQNESGQMLATTDCLIQGVHFTLETTTWHDLGWKSMAANLSDIAAMGGSPRYALITTGLPEDTQSEDVIELYRGMTELAARHDVAIVGGDTSAAPAVFINVALLAKAGEHLLTRGAARSGEAIAVTGNLGAAAGGLRLLTEHREITKSDSKLREAFLKPLPRIEEGELLLAEGVRCAIDVSDGLLGDLEHICQRSGLGAQIDTFRVPVHPALADVFGPEALEMALAGGEDYELIFTAPKHIVERVAAKSVCPITIIGIITAENPGKVTLFGPNAQSVSLDHQGWQHFAPKQP